MRNQKLNSYFKTTFTLITFYLSFTIIIVNGKIPVEKTELNLCCPIQRTDRQLVETLDCDQEPFVVEGTEELRYPWRLPQLLSPNNETVFYTLKYKGLTCEDGERTQVTIPSTSFGQNVTLLRNSYLQIGQSFYHHNEFCLKRFDTSTIHLEVCQPQCFSTDDQKKPEKPKEGEEIPRSTTCIRKCCPAGASLSMTGGRLACVSTTVNFTPRLFHTNYWALNKAESKAVDYHFVRTKPVCEKNTAIQLLPYGFNEAKKINHGNLCFRTRKNGNAYYRDEHRNWITTENYCTDSMVGFQGDLYENENTKEKHAVFVTCSNLKDKEKEQLASVSRKLYGGIMISSSIFLLLIFVVYLLLWEQRFPHGWTTIGHSSSMLLMYIFLGTAHILPDIHGHSVIQSFGCVSVAVLAHFFFLSTFCWLTLISFDLFWTFRSLAPKSSTIRSSRWVRRFFFYTFFGWGVPTICVIVGLILDSVYREAECSSVVIPGYGQNSCYLNPNSLGEYFYYPAAVLLFLNLLFFGITMWKLYEYKKSTRMATSSSSLDSKRQLFKLFTKLFFVQGLTWIFEVISWLHVGTDIPWYWTILDVINVFQALAIFLIYVCKQQTILALHKKYPCLHPLLDPLIRIFKCRPTTMDAEQSSSLNASMKTHDRRHRNSEFTKSMTTSTHDTEIT